MSPRTKYCIFLLFIIIALLCLYNLFSPRSLRESALPPAIALSAAALTDSFDNGEGRADSLYLDKTLSVTGVLAGTRRNESGRYVATLAGRYPGKTAVDCILDSLYTAGRLNLRVGQTVTILGRCAGQSLNVLLVQCILVKPRL